MENAHDLEHRLQEEVDQISTESTSTELFRSLTPPTEPVSSFNFYSLYDPVAKVVNYLYPETSTSETTLTPGDEKTLTQEVQEQADANAILNAQLQAQLAATQRQLEVVLAERVIAEQRTEAAERQVAEDRRIREAAEQQLEIRRQAERQRAAEEAERIAIEEARRIEAVQQAAIQLQQLANNQPIINAENEKVMRANEYADSIFGPISSDARTGAYYNFYHADEELRGQLETLKTNRFELMPAFNQFMNDRAQIDHDRYRAFRDYCDTNHLNLNSFRNN